MYAIIDIDGTLADNTHRSHFLEKELKDWEGFLCPNRVAKDTVIPGAKRGLEQLRQLNTDLIFLTGRNEMLRDTTSVWLSQNFDIVVPEEWLLMRPVGNLLKPSEYKCAHIQNLVQTLQCDRGFLFIDDDPYMWPIYAQYGLVLKAPDCWTTLFPESPEDLPRETNWRK